jgi:hypothetical protein
MLKILDHEICSTVYINGQFKLIFEFNFALLLKSLFYRVIVSHEVPGQ